MNCCSWIFHCDYPQNSFTILHFQVSNSQLSIVIIIPSYSMHSFLSSLFSFQISWWWLQVLQALIFSFRTFSLILDSNLNGLSLFQIMIRCSIWTFVKIDIVFRQLIHLFNLFVLESNPILPQNYSHNTWNKHEHKASRNMFHCNCLIKFPRLLHAKSTTWKTLWMNIGTICNRYSTNIPLPSRIDQRDMNIVWQTKINKHTHANIHILSGGKSAFMFNLLFTWFQCIPTHSIILF